MPENATQRVLDLAAYLAKTRGATLGEIVEDVPGYRVAGTLEPGSREWETVRRRLRRDLEDLEQLFGIETDVVEQTYEYRLLPPFLTGEERRALLAATAAVDVDGLGDAPVLGELGAAVDEHHQRIVLSVPDRVRDLCAAIREGAPVQFRYHGRVRTLDAYAVGRWRANWYVVGREHEADALRKYRLDRIEADVGTDAVTRAGDPGEYTVPADFVAVDELRLDPNDWGPDPLVVATVVVEADHVHNFQHELGGRVVARGDSDRTVELEVRHYTSFRDRLIGFRGHAVVVSPPELVALVRDHLAAVARGGA